MDKKYAIVGKFVCRDVKMVVISTKGATCVMPEYQYNGILETERKHFSNKKAKIA